MIVGSRHASVTSVHVASAGSILTEVQVAVGSFNLTPASIAAAQEVGCDAKGPHDTATLDGVGTALGLGRSLGLAVALGATDADGVGPDAQPTNRRANGTMDTSRRITHP